MSQIQESVRGAAANRKMRAVLIFFVIGVMGWLVTGCAAPATPSDGGAVRGLLPSPEQLAQINNNLLINRAEARFESAHVAPPEARLQVLVASLGRLRDKGFEGLPLLNSTCCDIFNRERATTYTLPGAGALFQLVSIPEQDNFIDPLLKENGQWGKGVLVVGGLLVYQKAFLNGAETPLGNYLVLLLGEDRDRTVLLINEELSPVVESRWRLRDLLSPVAEAYSFVTQDELCYSQQQYQACLSWQVADFTGNNGQIASGSVQRLIENGWLPPETNAISSVIASIESPDYASACTNELAETPEGLYERCQPDAVAYATEHQTRLPAQDGILAWHAGIGGLEVLQPLEGMVLDGEGQRTSLQPNSYRVDLLEGSEGGWLFQFVPADANDDGPFFYTEAVPIFGAGQLINGEEAGGENDVVLDALWYRACLRQTKVMIVPCAVNKWRRAMCINWPRVGWCDVIEPGTR